MDRYTRKEKPRPSPAINENEIRITSQGLIRNYISYAATLLHEKHAKEITLKAMGQVISKAVAIAEIIKKRYPGLHQDTSISSISITDVWEPIEEGLIPLEMTRHVSMIAITMSTREPSTKSPGYQAPLHSEKIKEEQKPQLPQQSQHLKQYQYRQPQGHGDEDSYGRGRGRGRGRGQGGIRGGYSRYGNNQSGYGSQGGYGYGYNQGGYGHNQGGYRHNQGGYGGYGNHQGGYGGYGYNEGGYGRYGNDQEHGGWNSNWGRGGGRSRGNWNYHGYEGGRGGGGRIDSRGFSRGRGRVGGRGRGSQF